MPTEYYKGDKLVVKPDHIIPSQAGFLTEVMN